MSKAKNIFENMDQAEILRKIKSKLVFIWNVDYFDSPPPFFLGFFHNLGHFFLGMLPLNTSDLLNFKIQINGLDLDLDF